MICFRVGISGPADRLALRGEEKSTIKEDLWVLWTVESFTKIEKLGDK